MPLPAFRRRTWEKYPIYYTDEAHDNLDDDPHEKRNTSKTLAEELAAYHRKESAANHACQKMNTSVDPEKRTKARAESQFKRKDNATTAAATVGSQSRAGGNATAGLGNANPVGRRTRPPVTNGKLQDLRDLRALTMARSQLGKSVPRWRK